MISGSKSRHVALYRAAAVVLLTLPHWAVGADEMPRVADGRLQIELFAESEHVVHPIGIAFDGGGNLLVIESHTHFPPDGYKGRGHDRILRLLDEDRDGRVDRVQTFFEGTKHTMDIARGRDGTIFVATRNELLSLRDTDGDGVADQKNRLVFLDTSGVYPHDGLCGLQFDFAGNIYFGMGENLGHAYRLIGSDGSTIEDEAEGGNVFWCTDQGKQLRRVATGFWNPFGIWRDVHGRLFAVDNDPAANGCRLLHVIEGGNYGYHYRYGRTGLHPFLSWRGQVPGTLPMICYTGEAPCELIAYEADGLPAKYQNKLMAACWSEHRVEVFQLDRRGASFTGNRQPLVTGGEDFRPVGLAIAPDGSLFISDWVKREYKLHGHGRIWRLSMRNQSKKADDDQGKVLKQIPLKQMQSARRSTREAAARQILVRGRQESLVETAVSDSTVGVRATALDALFSTNSPIDARVAKLATTDPSVAIRAQVVRGLASRGQTEIPTRILATADAPAPLKLASIDASTDSELLIGLLDDADPFLRSAAIWRLSRLPQSLSSIDAHRLPSPLSRIGVLLALRRSGKFEPRKVLPPFLADADQTVRFIAVKWIADERLSDFKQHIKQAINGSDVTGDLFFAYATALARLNNQPADERGILRRVQPRLKDPNTSSQTKAAILRGTPGSTELGRTDQAVVPIEVLQQLLADPDESLRLETVRYLAVSGQTAFEPLARVASDLKETPRIRAEAVAGLSQDADVRVPLLLTLADDPEQLVRAESIRALAGAKLDKATRRRLETLGPKAGPGANMVQRVLGKSPKSSHPDADRIDDWLALLDRLPPGKADTGRRIFSHRRLANCVRCHAVNGRGGTVGPDLSSIGRQSDRRAILQSMLQPGRRVAPQFATWKIVTNDGKNRTGFLVRQTEQDHTYIDAQGNLFTLKIGDIESADALPTSIMPDGLLDQLTMGEIRDLLAFLMSRQ